MTLTARVTHPVLGIRTLHVGDGLEEQSVWENGNTKAGFQDVWGRLALASRRRVSRHPVVWWLGVGGATAPKLYRQLEPPALKTALFSGVDLPQSLDAAEQLNWRGAGWERIYDEGLDEFMLDLAKGCVEPRPPDVIVEDVFVGLEKQTDVRQAELLMREVAPGGAFVTNTVPRQGPWYRALLCHFFPRVLRLTSRYDDNVVWVGSRDRNICAKVFRERSDKLGAGDWLVGLKAETVQ